MKRIQLLLLSIVLFPMFISLGQEGIDVIYLNNGDIIKGSIIENIPDDYLRIELSGGSIFTYKYSDILSFTLFPKVRLSNEVPQQSQNINVTSEIKNQFVKKDKTHAMWMSALWPGLGQFYNGPTESTKGTIMAIGQGVFLILTIIGAATPNEGRIGESGFDQYGNYHIDVEEPSINPLFWIGLVAMTGNAIYSMIDAGNVAEEINRNNGFSVIPENLSRFAWRDSFNLISLRINL